MIHPAFCAIKHLRLHTFIHKYTHTHMNKNCNTYKYWLTNNIHHDLLVHTHTYIHTAFIRNKTVYPFYPFYSTLTHSHTLIMLNFRFRIYTYTPHTPTARLPCYYSLDPPTPLSISLSRPTITQQLQNIHFRIFSIFTQKP